MSYGSVTAEGSPRIVDRVGRRQLPVGIESFEDVLRGFTYVDKTLAAADLINRRGVTLYCRPRRFGKSTFLRMLQCFFEAPVEGYVPDRRGLFEDLAISDADPRYMQDCGTHPVIYLELASCAMQTFEDTRDAIALQLSGEFSRHDYVYDSLRRGEVARFDRALAGEMRPAELASSLGWLSSLLEHYHGSQTVILIDECDAPVTEAHLCGYREEMVGFYRSWLTGAFKGTTSLYCAALTGVLRVSRESIFSGLNNIRIDTTLDEDHAEAIGFTEAEAEALAAHMGREADVGEMRAWYDGYRFGRTKVYNPWSVLNYLEGGIAQPYWTNTSRNGIVVDLIRHAGEDETVELATLSFGGTVAKPLDLRTVFDDLATNPAAVWAQLYQAGYVTTDDTGYPNDSRIVRALRVPNLEVGELFQGELLDRAARVAGGPGRLAALHRALLAVDPAATADALRRVLLDGPSYHDLVSERDYHVLVLALLYSVPGYRPATSNRESGDGRCDVLIEPLPERAGELPAIAMELKVAAEDGEAALGACARDVALAQAQRLEYGHGLAGAGLVRWGVAFRGKHVG